MLQLSEIQVSFGKMKVLNGLSLSVGQGETVGIIGPNGSGKITLFNCISGFVFPDSGTLALKGSDVTALSPDDRARAGLGRVF